MRKRLYRSRDEKVIAGVCGGVGKYFDIDPTLVRLVAIACVFLGGSGVLAYLLAWIIIPKERLASAGGFIAPEPTAPTVESSSTEPPADKQNDGVGRKIFGGALIAIGALLLLREHFWWLNIVDIVPVFLIALGLYLLSRGVNARSQKKEEDPLATASAVAATDIRGNGGNA